MFSEISYPLLKEALVSLLDNFTQSKSQWNVTKETDQRLDYFKCGTIVWTGIVLLILSVIKYKNDRKEKVRITPWKFHQIIEHPIILCMSLSLIIWVLMELMIFIKQLEQYSILFNFFCFILSLIVSMLVVYPISSSITTEMTSIKINGFIYSTVLLANIAVKFFYIGINVGSSYFTNQLNLIITINAALTLTIICIYNLLKILTDKSEHRSRLRYLYDLYIKSIFNQKMKISNDMKEICDIPANLYCIIYLSLVIVFAMFAYFIMLLTGYLYNYLINYNHDRLLSDVDLILTTNINLDNDIVGKLEYIMGFVIMIIYYELICCGFIVILYQLIQMHILINRFKNDVYELQHGTSDLIDILNQQSTDPISNSLLYPSYQMAFVIIGSVIQYFTLSFLVSSITLYGTFHYLTTSWYGFDYKSFIIPFSILTFYLGIHLLLKVILKRPIFRKQNQQRFLLKKYSYRFLYFSEIISFVLLLLIGLVGIFRNVVAFILGIISMIKDFSRTDLPHHVYPSYSIGSIGFREYTSYVVVHYMHTNPLVLFSVDCMQNNGGNRSKRRWEKMVSLINNPKLIKYSKTNENMLKFD